MYLSKQRTQVIVRKASLAPFIQSNIPLEEKLKTAQAQKIQK